MKISIFPSHRKCSSTTAAQLQCSRIETLTQPQHISVSFPGLTVGKIEVPVDHGKAPDMKRLCNGYAKETARLCHGGVLILGIT